MCMNVTKAGGHELKLYVQGLDDDVGSGFFVPTLAALPAGVEAAATDQGGLDPERILSKGGFCGHAVNDGALTAR